jgi:hypothetical protein
VKNMLPEQDEIKDWAAWTQEKIAEGQTAPAAVHLVALAAQGRCSWHEAIMGGLAAQDAYRNTQRSQEPPTAPQ